MKFTFETSANKVGQEICNKIITKYIHLFADDTIAYNSASNHTILKDDLAKLEQWEQQWHMEFQPSNASTLSSQGRDNQLLRVSTNTTLRSKNTVTSGTSVLR